MHIPDGYLSPQTYLPFYAFMIPFWGVATRKVRATLRLRHLPLLALAAAFSFVVMMFNIPAPFATTGHAVGGVVAAVVLGPWAACLAVSLAVVIQALLFGDGGITAIAANCFNMAVVIPFVGYYSYRLIAGNSALTDARRLVAGAVAGYVALNAAALYTAVEFGIQPMIAAAPDGRPLYAPYPLSVAVPAMAATHLLFFGFIEAVVTVLVIKYLQQENPSLLQLATARGGVQIGGLKRLWSGVAVLALLSPLGIILPAAFNSGTPWGEWSIEELRKLIGFVPVGLQKVGVLWHAPFPDYAFAGGDKLGLMLQSVTYVASAFAGMLLVVACILLCGKFLASGEPE